MLQAETARTIGEVSDGSIATTELVDKPLPNYKIQSSQIKYVKGQKFTINRIEQPVIEPKEELTAAEQSKRDKDFQELLKTLKPWGGTFFVTATIYDHERTIVQFSHNREAYEFWSNVDWNYFSGFATFEGRGKRYDMMLLSSNAFTERINAERKLGYKVSDPQIPQMPDLESKGPRYMVTKGDTNNDEVMEFIEAIHDLYAAESVKLISAYQKRLGNSIIQALKNEELRKNPPPKPDVTINFWKRDVVRERQEEAAKKEGEQR